MRQLTTNDVFKMSRILSKLGIKPDFAADSDERFGVDLILKIAESAHLAQSEINGFLGDLCGMTGEEFGNLPIKDSMEKIKEFKSLDGIKDFFGYVGQLTK